LCEEGVLLVNDGYRAKNVELGGDGPIFLRGGLVQRDRISFHDAERFRKNVIPKLQSKLSKPFDVVVTTKGWSTGRTTFMREGFPEVVYSPHMSFWRCLDRTRLDPGYLRQWSRSPQFAKQLEALAGTCTLHPYLSLANQQRLRIELPPIDEQRRIAGVLGALDDKIELNRKMNRTLEEMAQAIFKSWFIDFDGVPQSEMVDSELGPIPSGGSLASVPELLRLNPKTKLARGAFAKFVDMKALSTTGCYVDRVVEKEMKSGGAKFVGGDTLLARITPCLENGKTAYVDFLEEGEVGFGSTEFIVLRPVDKSWREWVYCLARSDVFRKHAISNMTGSSGRQRVPVDCFDHLRFVRPEHEAVQEFSRVAAPCFKKIGANAEQSRTLAGIRDALLPKLISGEIRVPEAEKAVEAVL